MLVLSRRCNEKIVLPSIGATIEVVAIKSGAVKLGIEAPPEVPILRQELEARAAEWQESPSSLLSLSPALPENGLALEPASEAGSAPAHDPKKLQRACNALGLARLQLRAGLTEEAEVTLAKLHKGFQMWRKRSRHERAAVQRPSVKHAHKSHRVLLVEDNANERELLALLLRRSGLAVDTAGDGIEALDRLKDGRRPDMVLLDMGLPRCDGPTTVREIRRNPDYNGLKIFAVSGHSANEYEWASDPSGIDRWFCKPLDTDALIHDVSQELELCGV